MAIKKNRPAALAIPSRHWAQRATLTLIVLLSLALLVMSKTGNPAVSRLRGVITDVAVPVLSAAASPVEALHDAGEWLGSFAHLREENAVLHNQNIELLKWQAAAKTMQAENESLRQLLNVVPAQKSRYITAKVVSDMSGPYVQSVLIDGGSEDGIRRDEAVVSENGLIGRIVDTGARSARVLLLGDINSRVPVVAEQTQEKAILSGTNSATPVLSYLAVGSRIAVGERLVTSGDGGVFPEGVPVGVVIGVGPDGVRVQPYSDAVKARYVSVLDYAL